MGRILYECHFEIEPSLLILGITIIAAFLISGIQKKAATRVIKQIKIICLCFALFGIVSICILIDMYRKTVIAYKNGNYQTVEGYVENFDPMPYGGHKDETFEINGVKFGYSDYTIMTGYHNTKSHGGVIRDNGQYLKIGYVHYGNENIIVYIEEYSDKNIFDMENLYSLIQKKNETYELTVKNRQGKIIFQEQYTGEPRVESLYNDTFLIVRGRGDWHVYTFINIETEVVSEEFSDISAWNHEKVVYATFEDGKTKIIIQDIYDKNVYYMEVIRDFSPEAIPYRLILKAEFLNDSQLMLEYYSGKNWEEVSEVVNL